MGHQRVHQNDQFALCRRHLYANGEFCHTYRENCSAKQVLQVYDANSEPTAIPSAGYLGGFNNFQFGVYTPQPYTPLNEFRCATCNTNAAVSVHEKQALAVLLGTCTVTVLSFTWFAGVVGLF